MFSRFVSLVILLIYYLLLFGGISLALRSIVPPIVGVWLANLIYFIIGIFLNFVVIEK